MILSGFERRWAEKIFDAIIPPGIPGLHGGAVGTGASGRTVELLEQAPVSSMLGLRAAIWMVQLSPLFGLHLTLFSRMPADERERLIVRLLSSKNYLVRQAVLMLKLSICLSFGGDRKMHEAVGIYSLNKAEEGSG